MIRLARWGFVTSVVATVLGLSKVHAAWVADPAYDYTGSSRLGWSLAYIATLLVIAYAAGLPDLPRRTRSALAAAALTAVGGALALSLVQLLGGAAVLPRFVVFGTALVVVPVGTVANVVARGGRSRAEDRDRVLLVGDGSDRLLLTDELEGNPERPAALVGHLFLSEAAEPGVTALVDAVAETGARVVVLARDAQTDEHVVAQAARLHASGVRIRTLSLFYEEWLGKLPLSELERVGLLFDIGELHRARYGRVKRVFDLAVASIALVPLALLIPFVVVGNLVANRGPLLYTQERVGRFGERFWILKLRTMVPDEGGATDWTAEGDPRVTPFGRLLRSTHLDELPQVFNIIRGDLSVVGPRPEQTRYVDELTEKLPFYDLRHLVRPGLTGWAQVSYGYAGDEADAIEKLQYEFFYLRHQQMRFDLRILGRTIRSVAGSEGRGR